MIATQPWTVDDLAQFPDDDGNRYEIINGELHITEQPHYHHQSTCNRVALVLTSWSDQTQASRVFPAPGVIFAVDNAVAPDVVWMSRERFAQASGPDGKLHAAPELVVEVLSFGGRNEARDRELKLDLYSRWGVREYWILDWRTRQMEVYRRQDNGLRLAATLYAEDTLTSPLMPGFTCLVSDFFRDLTA